MHSAVETTATVATVRTRTSFAPFLVYVAAFHLLWIAWPVFLYPRLVAVGSETLTYALIALSVRFLYWIAPVLLYLRYVDGVDPFEYLRMTPPVRRGLLLALVLTAINVIGTFARFGMPHLSWQRVTWNSVLGTSFLIGFFEEIPYRGFMLRKFSERMNVWLANLVTSLLFLSIHLPGWIALHIFNPGTAVSVFLLGVVFAWAVTYSGSLWSAIITHSANDCLTFVIFGM
jgi:membrane protease YdiL (CAAX protease family)